MIKDKEVIENCPNLFFIERAFHMNKTDLAICSIIHQLFYRIEAHVYICFTAYTILLELERTLKKTRDKNLASQSTVQSFWPRAFVKEVMRLLGAA